MKIFSFKNSKVTTLFVSVLVVILVGSFFLIARQYSKSNTDYICSSTESVSDNKCLGNNYGIQINGESSNVDINGVTITNLEAGLIYTNADSFNLSDKVYYYSTFPTEDAVGINVKSDCDNIKIGTIYGSEIVSPAKNLAQLLRYELN
jgi:hypothetical protein